MTPLIQNLIIIVVSTVLLIIILAITFFVYPIILGSFPFLRARKLAEEDIVAIKSQGLCHKTTNKGLKGIQKESTIRGSKGTSAYSTRRKKAVFFFANSYITRGEDFNENPKYNHIVKITNLTDEQIQNMRIRNYDSAIMYLGDFQMIEENKVEYIDMQRNYGFWKKLFILLKALPGAMKPSKYLGACLISVSISLIPAILAAFGLLNLICQVAEACLMLSFYV